MKILVSKNKEYCIYKVGIEYLYQIIDFTVRTNYSKHLGLDCNRQTYEEVQNIYLKERTNYSSISTMYIAENTNKTIIGSIKVANWNKTDKLPMQEVFNINPLSHINDCHNASFWHVGRFAINSQTGSNLLFKHLMMLALVPIYNNDNSYLLAECDSKLVKVINYLGLKTINLGDGVNYLGSNTIPLYANRDCFKDFFQRNYKLIADLNDVQVELPKSCIEV